MKFKLLSGSEDNKTLHDFRCNVYADNHKYLLIGNDSFYDEYSLNFVILNSKSEIIGASRCTPFKDGKWEASDVAPEKHLQFDPNSYVQYNRVVIKRDYRNNSLHEYMFKHVALWLFNNSSYKKFFSICEIPILRSYSKFNIRPIGDPFNIKSRENKQYSLIEGSVNEIVSIFGTQHTLRTTVHSNFNKQKAWKQK